MSKYNIQDMQVREQPHNFINPKGHNSTLLLPLRQFFLGEHNKKKNVVIFNHASHMCIHKIQQHTSMAPVL